MVPTEAFDPGLRPAHPLDARAVPAPSSRGDYYRVTITTYAHRSDPIPVDS